MDMASKEPRCHFFEVLGMVDEAKVVLDLCVPKVVPVAAVVRIQSLEKIWEIAFEGDGFAVLPIFNAKLDAVFAGVVHRFGEHLQDSGGVEFLNFFASLNGGEFPLDELSGVHFPLLNHFAESRGVFQRADATGMNNDKRGTKFFRPLDC